MAELGLKFWSGSPQSPTHYPLLRLLVENRIQKKRQELNEAHCVQGVIQL